MFVLIFEIIGEFGWKIFLVKEVFIEDSKLLYFIIAD